MLQCMIFIALLSIGSLLDYSFPATLLSASICTVLSIFSG